MAPLMPAAIVLAVFACSKLSSHPYYQRFAVAAATIAALVWHNSIDRLENVAPLGRRCAHGRLVCCDRWSRHDSVV